MAEKKLTSYGLRSVYVVPLVSDSTEATIYGEELVRCWGAQEASVNIQISSNELRGDDQIVEFDSVVSGTEFEASNAVFTFEQAKVLAGGAIEDILATEEGTPAIGKKYQLKGGQSLPYFGLIATTEKDGTLKVILSKCKISSLEFEFSDEEYLVVSFSGSGIARASDSGMFQMLKYDANNPVAVADLN